MLVLQISAFRSEQYISEADSVLAHEEAIHHDGARRACNAEGGIDQEQEVSGEHQDSFMSY